MRDHVCDVTAHVPVTSRQSPPKPAKELLGLYDRFVQEYCLVRELHQTFGQEMEAQGQAQYFLSLLITILLVSAQGEGMRLPSECVCVCSYVCVCARVRVYCAYSNTNVSESIVIKRFIQMIIKVHHTFSP